MSFNTNRIITITSFHQFIEEVEFHTVLAPNDLMLYRGQANSSWRLEPSIARKLKTGSLGNTEQELMNEFKRLGRHHIPKDVIDNPWDLLAFAQHHGLMTRLLDWSTNPLIALWFAFNEQAATETRSVWYMFINYDDIADTTEGNPYTQRITLAFKPNHVTQRITAQSGWFTTHKYHSTERFTPLDALPLYEKRLYRFDFDNTLRDNILKTLDKFGINGASVFPDLYGLTNYLNWRIT